KLFKEPGRFKAKPGQKRPEKRTCFHCKKPGHIQTNDYSWKKQQADRGNEKLHQ
ncbi:TPA: hypothetical protein N0F65_011039, partial [Lagenidium giganteum]